MKTKLKLTAEQFDAFAETGKSIVPYLKLKTLRRVHGGPRQGAGRKPSGRVQYVTRLRPELIARVKAEAERQGRNECEIVEKALAGSLRG
jgi:hypothetical protein